MVRPRSFLVLVAVLLALPLLTPPVEGQILNRLRDRAARTVESTLSAEMDRRIRDAVRCSLDDTACAEQARRDGKQAVFVDAEGQVVTDDEGNPIYDVADARATESGPGAGVWSNYDFVPGNDVVFALDLETERVGRFPARQLEFVEGAAQIVEREGIRMLEFTAPTRFRVNLASPLPDDFTLEMTYRAGVRNAFLVVSGPDAPGNMASYDYSYLNLWGSGGIYFKREAISTSDALERIDDEMLPIKLQVDGDPEITTGGGDYAILYAGTTRAAMVPNATFERNQALEFHVTANGSRPAYLSELVVAIHGDPLYDALTTGDRTFTTRGILFDFDSDRLRGESTPTLAELLSTLERNPDLRVRIEGHTDASGEDNYNRELSERRAQAVVEHLAEAGISRDRLESVGMGESEPVADNSSEAGRQQNRRVVIRAL